MLEKKSGLCFSGMSEGQNSSLFIPVLDFTHFINWKNTNKEKNPKHNTL